MLIHDPDFLVGVDLGQTTDPSALVVVEQQRWLSVRAQRALQLDTDRCRWVSPTDYHPALAERIRAAEAHGRPPQVPLVVVSVERLPLGTRYPAVVDRLVSLVRAIRAKDRTVDLILDLGGPGRPVFDALVRARLPVAGVSITAGNAVRFVPDDGDVWHVAKSRLIMTAQAMIQRGQVAFRRAGAGHAESRAAERRGHGDGRGEPDVCRTAGQPRRHRARLGASTLGSAPPG